MTPDYIQILRDNAQLIRTRFGVRSMCVFGSVARNTAHAGSDVDICVDMNPGMYMIIELKLFIEKLLNTTVDLVRRHRNMNPYFLSEIQRDGITIF